MSFDSHVRASLQRMLTGLRDPLERELRAYAEQLDQIAARAAEDAAAAAAADARRSAERQLADLRDTAARAVEAGRAEAAAARAAAAAAERAAEARLAEASREAQRGLDVVHAELADARAAQAAEARALQDVRAALENARGEVDTIVAALDTTRQELVAARTALATTREELAAARTALESARPGTAPAAGLEEIAARDAFAGVEDDISALADAGSLGAVLDTLAVQAGRLAARAAVFVVTDAWLRDWALVGFPLEGARGRRLELALDDAGVLAPVIHDGRSIVHVETTDPEDGATRPAFAVSRDRRALVALPLNVGGRTVALLYADSPAEGRVPAWARRLSLLTRCASLVLEATTAQYASGLRSVPTGAGTRTASDHAVTPGGWSETHA